MQLKLCYRICLSMIHYLYIADSLTQPTTLLHDDNITSDDITDSGQDDLEGDTTQNDVAVLLNHEKISL